MRVNRISGVNEWRCAEGEETGERELGLGRTNIERAGRDESELPDIIDLTCNVKRHTVTLHRHI